jgi:hypothetical protein
MAEVDHWLYRKATAELPHSLVRERELEFVEWLKDHGMYNSMASTKDMQMMFAIWVECQNEND